MKSTGIVRQVDELGRIVLPIELRRNLSLNEGDPVEFFFDGEMKRLLLRKYRTQECLFCGSLEALSHFRDRYVCSSCLLDMRRPKSGLASIAEPEVAATLEGGKELPELKPRKRGTQAEALKRLAEVMHTYPQASQGEWAKLIEVSPGYVSQLIRHIK